MTIELIKPVKIGRKTHAAGTVLTVINEVGYELVATGKAYCRDGTYKAELVKYVKPTKQKKK